MKNNIISQIVPRGMTYQSYSEIVKKIVSEGKSTGIEQTVKQIEFTKLNASRMQRLDKTIKIQKEAISVFQAVNTKQTWLVILESWCADGAQTIPVLNKICEINANLTLRIVLRDKTPELMDLFLTNGTRSIPKLIVLDEDNKVVNTWGPRSAMATKMVEAYKIHNGAIDDSFKKFLQIWYNKDMGESIIEDLMKLTKQSFYLENN